MSNLVDIRGLLSYLHLTLIQYCGERGLTVDDPDFPRKIEELNRINESLWVAIRDLKSAQHSAAAREQSLWKIPRDRRYGPAASVGDQQREIDELMRDAIETRKLVDELLGRISSGNEMEGIHTVAELSGQATGHESGTAEQAVPSHPAYVPGGQAHFQASPETLVIMAYVAARGLVLLGKKVVAKISS